MAKKQPPEELLRELEKARHWVKHFEANGDFNTVHHQHLERAERAVAKYHLIKAPVAEKEN